LSIPLAAVVGLFALGISSANADVSFTYCDQVTVAPGHGCTRPPGRGTDPCNIYHSWGGWTENYANTSQQGQFPNMYGLVQYYPGGCSGASDVCFFYDPNERLHHMNDGGCAATYSWNVGKDVDLLVGIGTGANESWTISGAGHYP
jgi:hypothetical protein